MRKRERERFFFNYILDLYDEYNPFLNGVNFIYMLNK